MSIPIPPGVFDILPNAKENWRDTRIWNYVESMIREITRDYGYHEIRTPIFERTELFARGVGETSDIVSKEMYTFDDKGGRSMSLRPEGSAPVMRSFIENNLDQSSPCHKLCYIAPMFRYERAQAGRYRQHHQFGAEAIGNGSPEQDVELIDMIYTFFQRLGLKHLQLNINSIGDTACRLKFRQALQDFLRPLQSQLSNDSQARFNTNPLRILDSKDPNDQKLIADAPSILDFLSDECKEHFNVLQQLLNQLNIPFKVNARLVRGLDYYNRTVFEIVAGELGAQNSIAGGGRYDGLMKLLGGPDLPCMGFGAGIERIIQTMLKQEVEIPAAARPTLFFIALGEEARKVCFTLTHELRQQGISVQMDFSNRKLGKIMQYADYIQAKYVAVVGENELKTKEIDIKEMATGSVTKVPLFHLGRILRLDEKWEDFLTGWQEMSAPFKHPLETQFFINKLSQSINQTKHLAEELQSVAEKIKGIM